MIPFFEEYSVGGTLEDASAYLKKMELDLVIPFTFPLTMGQEIVFVDSLRVISNPNLKTGLNNDLDKEKYTQHDYNSFFVLF